MWPAEQFGVLTNQHKNLFSLNIIFSFLLYKVVRILITTEPFEFLILGKLHIYPNMGLGYFIVILKSCGVGLGYFMTIASRPSIRVVGHKHKKVENGGKKIRLNIVLHGSMWARGGD